MPPDPISRSAAKEAIEAAIWKCTHEHPVMPACDHQRRVTTLALAALDSLPAAEADGRKVLDPEEVKAVLSEVLTGMDLVWAEAAINAMAGIHVGDAPSPPAAEGVERP